MKHNEIKRSTLDRLDYSRRLLEVELSSLNQVLRPAILGKFRVDQGQLGLCLSHCERALSKLREAIDASKYDGADCDNKQYALNLEDQCECAEQLLAHARQFQSGVLVVSEVEGNVIHLAAERKRDSGQCFEHMLKALEIDMLLRETQALRLNACPEFKELAELKGIEGSVTLDQPLNRSKVNLKLV